jgi:hypothetical protein
VKEFLKKKRGKIIFNILCVSLTAIPHNKRGVNENHDEEKIVEIGDEQIYIHEEMGDFHAWKCVDKIIKKACV